MYATELRPRLNTDLADKRLPCPAVGLECLGLAATAIEGNHQLSDQLLPCRIAREQHLQFTDYLGVVPELQVRLDASFEGRESKLVQASDLRLGELFIGDLRQRWATPQSQRLAEHSGSAKRLALVKCPPAVLQACLENISVELAGLHREQVATAHRLQSRVAVRSARIERLAQPRNRHM